MSYYNKYEHRISYLAVSAFSALSGRGANSQGHSSLTSILPLFTFLAEDGRTVANKSRQSRVTKDVMVTMEDLVFDIFVDFGGSQS